MLPEIRIKNARLLREHASMHLHELWGKDSKFATPEEIDEIVKNYQEAWRPYEKRILGAMTDILGLEFRQNIIDVYIAPWFMAFSDPLVVGIRHTPDRFIDVLTHELLHRMLTDNTATLYEVNMFHEWKKLFGDGHLHITTVHIPVHAVHTAIYLDYLKEPQRLQRDQAIDKKHANEGYVRSWEYVEECGYEAVIQQLRNFYQNKNS